MPILAFAPSADVLARPGDARSGAMDQAQEAVRGCLRRGQALAVKPRHGANSQQVSLFPEPLPDAATEAAVFAAMRDAAALDRCGCVGARAELAVVVVGGSRGLVHCWRGWVGSAAC